MGEMGWGGRGRRGRVRGAHLPGTESFQGEVLLLLFGGSATKFTQGSSSSSDKGVCGSVALEIPRISVSTTTLGPLAGHGHHRGAPATILATADS